MMTPMYKSRSSRLVATAARYLPAGLCILLASLPSCGKDSPTMSEPGIPVRITLSPSVATLTAVGQTLQLTVAVLDGEGKDIEGAVVAWTSSNPSVVKVDDRGVATALINGWVDITAVSGGATAVASIIVMQAPARIEITPASSTLIAPGETVQLYYTVYDRNGVPIPGAGVVWSSGDHSVATVSATGLVTAVGRGSTRIASSSGEVGEEASIMVARVAGAAGNVRITP